MWRGNVRELRNFVFRAALISREEEIDTGIIKSLLDTTALDSPSQSTGDISSAIADWLEEVELAPGNLYHGALAVLEKPLFEHALSETRGNQLKAAQLLGINRNTLRKRLSELAIDPEGFVRPG